MQKRALYILELYISSKKPYVSAKDSKYILETRKRYKILYIVLVSRLV